MPFNAMWVNSAATNGGDGLSTSTVEINFAPYNNCATCAVSGFGNGEGEVASAGILSARTRSEDGSDSPHQFGVPQSFSLPNYVALNRMSSVTMLVNSYDGWARGLLTVYGFEGGEWV
jgi:hypothetical protein